MKNTDQTLPFVMPAKPIFDAQRVERIQRLINAEKDRVTNTSALKKAVA